MTRTPMAGVPHDTPDPTYTPLRYMGALRPRDLKYLTERGLSQAVIQARGYCVAMQKTALANLGYTPKQRLIPALVIPIRDGRGELAAYMIRPDEPRIDKGKPRKFEFAGGSHMALDVPSGARDRLGDPAVPLFITEGPVKADCAVGHGLACIALLGVWNWRGTNDLGGKTALPDWESIALNGRTLYIAFDSDVTSKPEVRAALVRLKAFLESRGAHVQVVYLPCAADGSKVGLDDFFAHGGTVPVLLSYATETVRALEGDAASPGDLEADTGLLTPEDFFAHMPAHNYLRIVSRSLWPAESVNARVPPVCIGTDQDGEPIYLMASVWLDKHRPIEQMTWAPGEPQEIQGRLIHEGGWVEHPGVTVFNLYRPPMPVHGDPTAAGQWLAHVHRIYPDNAAHIIQWLAHRVQRPGEKLNHALVLGGLQGIGKDTLLAPVAQAIGPWNFREASPSMVMGRFNPHLKAVILRISEARDLGEINRFVFYDHLKVITAAPPDALVIDEKNLREHMIPNVVGVVITTNHRMDGIYLPADDRRHYVAWSECVKEAFTPDYWTTLWRWYADGGSGHVAAYLAAYDLHGFDPKAPPPKTDAFYAICDAGRAPESADLAEAIEKLAYQNAVTVEIIAKVAGSALQFWLEDRKSRKAIPHRLEDVGYVVVRNPDEKREGRWKIGDRQQRVFARQALTPQERLLAARQLQRSYSGAVGAKGNKGN